MTFPKPRVSVRRGKATLWLLQPDGANSHRSDAARIGDQLNKRLLPINHMSAERVIEFTYR